MESSQSVSPVTPQTLPRLLVTEMPSPAFPMRAEEVQWCPWVLTLAVTHAASATSSLQMEEGGLSISYEVSTTGPVPLPWYSSLSLHTYSLTAFMYTRWSMSPSAGTKTRSDLEGP